MKDLSLKSIVQYVLDEDRQLNFNLSVDALTGASPNGAVRTDSVQTFTRPSGSASYQTSAGELPVDDTFHDTRYALAGNCMQAFCEASRITLGLSGSTEYDYLYVGADVRYEHDFNQRNTTLFVGAAYGDETIEPEGGVLSFGGDDDVHGWYQVRTTHGVRQVFAAF